AGVRCVMKDAEGVNKVERPRIERHFREIRLKQMNVGPPGQIFSSDIDGEAEVDANHRGAVPRRDLREAPGAAARVEHHLPFEPAERPIEAGLKLFLRPVACARAVELRTGMLPPFITEARHIAIVGHKAWNSIANR